MMPASYTLPAYLDTATPIDFAAIEDTDAGYVASQDEMEYDWVDAVIPLSAIAFDFPLTRLALVSAGLARAVEEIVRFRRIDKWIGKRSIGAAISESPLVLIVDAQGLVCLDGWHRAVIAFERGETSLRAYIAISPTPEAPARRRGAFDQVQADVATSPSLGL